MRDQLEDLPGECEDIFCMDVVVIVHLVMETGKTKGLENLSLILKTKLLSLFRYNRLCQPAIAL